MRLFIAVISNLKFHRHPHCSDVTGAPKSRLSSSGLAPSNPRESGSGFKAKDVFEGRLED
jgi:hypothetical protein